MKALFVVEGFTDIRFVLGLNEICDLTLLVPEINFQESGLDKRILESGVTVRVHQLKGGRLQYQFQCFRYLLANGRKFDVVLSQEMLRGGLNSCVAGKLLGVPVVTYTCLPALEYYRCRRSRSEIGRLKSFAGESFIQTLLWLNGKLATRCVALGPYLRRIVSQVSSRTRPGLYYGVDVDLYSPVGIQRKCELRRELSLPTDQFVIFLSSRISHEKDPETVLRATALARARGLDAVVINLGGGYLDFLRLAEQLALPDCNEFVLGRPAAHPMRDLPNYYRAADCMALASLEEGLGMSPLESLACGTPAVCTAVGGLADNLNQYARLTPKGDADSMAEQFLWIAKNRDEARAQALVGRDFVIREWNRGKAFSDLAAILSAVATPPNDSGRTGL
jgi:glycosyltransferase involved in cell wall biosynthesis